MVQRWPWPLPALLAWAAAWGSFHAARAVGLSRSRFSVLFAADTRVSPQAYIESMRMTRAAQLLTMSAWPVAQIAEEVGIPNAYYFSTRFRARFGMPPTAWRARHESPERTAS